MTNETAEEIDKQIIQMIDDLRTLEIGSSKYIGAVNSLKTLCQISLDNDKNHIEDEVNYERKKLEEKKLQQELDLIEKQKREDNIDRIIKIGVSGAELMIPIIFYGKWMRAGFKFEENGTYTSQTFKGLFGKFKPTK